MTGRLMMKSMHAKKIYQGAVTALMHLNPWLLRRNIVMLIVEIGAIVTLLAACSDFFGGKSFSLSLQISMWLWLTVIFSNFAEALAELQVKARAE
jgi:potassium-transporting ATPase ATP-binding subunit